MFLYKLLLNLKCKEVRRDLSNAYEMHSTLTRAFSQEEFKCLPGSFLWRQENGLNSSNQAVVIVQSNLKPNWSNIRINDWLDEKPCEGIDLNEKLSLEKLVIGDRFRFRLKANPCVTRSGKRQGLLKLSDQANWLKRKGEMNGFAIAPLSSSFFDDDIDVMISNGMILQGHQRSGNKISILSVVYDGILTVSNPDNFKNALVHGIGHGKSMGLGMLSLASLK